MKKSPLEMSRHELIDALRGHVNPNIYQDVCYMPTAVLRGTLVAFQCPKEEGIAPERPKPPVLELQCIEDYDLKEEIIDLMVLAMVHGMRLYGEWSGKASPSSRFARWLRRV